jgi:predicted MPP superfamily phosphohydrolase
VSIFFIVFLSIYSALHAYSFFRARQVLAFGPVVSTALLVFMAAMVFVPLLVHAVERGGYESSARVLAWIGYTWMGVHFLFFSSSIACDLYRCAIALLGRAGMNWPAAITLSGRHAFFLSVVLAVGCSIYGYFEALDIRVERVVIKSPKISEAIGRLRVVQVSDVHVGLIVGKYRLERILGKVREEKPDIFVSTGDLVDGQIDGLAPLAGLFQEITPKYGKYAITGNHEFYAGIDQALAFTRDAGFRVLQGEAVTIDGVANIAGVDDPAGATMGIVPREPETVILERLPRTNVTILLKHRPLVKPESFGLFDLQLSGHIHKGQIFPFILLTRLAFPVTRGLTMYEHNSRLYISRGSGTWGPPMRFLAPPEVTVIDFVHEGK